MVSARTFFVLFRIKLLSGSKGEMPDDFLNELHKWSLECKYSPSVLKDALTSLVCIIFFKLSPKWPWMYDWAA